ncbi:MAG TPA: NYN domain-containing protein [Clostridia bacterium]
MNRTAILIDGGFFVKRAIKLWGKKSPEELAKILQDYCIRHIKQNREDYHQLYRIFYYDCPPINKKMHHPLSNRLIDYAKTEQYEWRLAFHEQLRKLRKMALRLGHLDEEGTNWNLDPRLLRSVITGKLPISKLREEDIVLNTKQKGVDMRIGVDIASMAYKKQVEQMILIAGDSDFVPAAKLARREGIDFILDPLWSQIKPDLFEHIDGLRTVCEKPLTGGESFDDAGSKAEMGYDDGEDEDSSIITLSADVVETPAPVPAPAPPVTAAQPAPSSSAPQQVPGNKPSRRRSTKPRSTPKPQESPADAEPAPVAPVSPAPALSPATEGEARPVSSRSASRRRRRSNKSAATAAAAASLAGSAESKEPTTT